MPARRCSTKLANNNRPCSCYTTKMNIGDKKLMLLLLLCVATLLLASAILYYLGFSSDTANNTVLQTSSTTPTSTTSVVAPQQKPPVVVPSKNLHVTPSKTCKVGGCSGEICSDKEMLSNCMYSPEYSCYKSAKCEVQPSGECGWTPSSELDACIRANVSVTPSPQ